MIVIVLYRTIQSPKIGSVSIIMKVLIQDAVRQFLNQAGKVLGIAPSLFQEFISVLPRLDGSMIKTVLVLSLQRPTPQKPQSGGNVVVHMKYECRDRMKGMDLRRCLLPSDIR